MPYLVTQSSAAVAELTCYLPPEVDVLADWDETLLGVWNKVQADTAQQTCEEVRNNDDEPTLPSCTLHVSIAHLAMTCKLLFAWHCTSASRQSRHCY